MEGALSAASAAVAARDYGALFRALDERARFSLDSVRFAARASAQEIRATYPRDRQAAALEELGDAAAAKDGPSLLAARCDDVCLDAIGSSLGAPSQTRTEDRLTTVTTVRGTTVQLYRAEDGRYGLVWESEALMRERTRAAAQLDLIKKNGLQFKAQRALD